MGLARSVGIYDQARWSVTTHRLSLRWKSSAYSEWCCWIDCHRSRSVTGLRPTGAGGGKERAGQARCPWTTHALFALTVQPAMALLN